MPGFLMLLLLCLGYLLGCCTVGYYLVRYYTGRDIRQLGSGSTGASNVGRELGYAGFLVTLAGDASKGMLAVWMASACPCPSYAAVAVMIAVVVGHIWPVQLRFRGGKGVAPTLGGMLAYDLRLTLLLLGVFGLAYLVTRQWVRTGLGMMALAPLVALGLRRPPEEVVGLVCLVLLIGVAHRDHLHDQKTDLSPIGRDAAGEPQQP